MGDSGKCVREEKLSPSSGKFWQESAMPQQADIQFQQPSSVVSEDSAESFISVVVKEEERDDDPGEIQQNLPPQQSEQSQGESEFVETDEMQYFRSSCQGQEEEGTGRSTSVSSLPNSEPDTEQCPEGELQGASSFPCQHCERHFSTKQGLERHTHIHISANCHTHMFKCRYCGKPFSSQVGRRRHERRHENGPTKKLGSLSGSAASPSPSLQLTDNSCQDLVASPDGFITIGSQNCGEPQEGSEAEKPNSMVEVDQTFVLDENGGSKEHHPCKYCKKVFGTHTNKRRHERRIHERRPVPKGVGRKGVLLVEAQPYKQQTVYPPEESSSACLPPVYVPSGDLEDDGNQEEECMVDISGNISENLSLYMDGKILSTASVSNFEVIEVDSCSATLFDLDALIISPDQFSQALKVETATCTVKESPVQAASKRRTATPPLLPKIKTESVEGLMSSVSSASSSTSLVVFPQPIETSAFHTEKNVYLSPKLKQLLQTKDEYKPSLAPIADCHRPGPPPPVAALPVRFGRFKRRTASPPNSSQHSPVVKIESLKSEAAIPFIVEVSKLENQCSSPACSLSSKDERDSVSPTGLDSFNVIPVEWSSSQTGGSSCNQQPLDLSIAVSKRNVCLNISPGDSVLDLSMHRKSSNKTEVSEGLAKLPLIKKKKPNTSMLEKVLMSEYGGLEVAGEECSGVLDVSTTLAEIGTSTNSSPGTYSNLNGLSELTCNSVSFHPPPPSLTPVTIHPPSPFIQALGSSTPPPPILPTIPSPVPVSMSPEHQHPCPLTKTSVPILSPKTSPRPIEISNEEHSSSSEHSYTIAANIGNFDFLTKPLNQSARQEIHTFLTNQSSNQMTLQTSSECSSSSPTIPSNFNVNPLSISHRAVVIECTLSLESSQNFLSSPISVAGNSQKTPSVNLGPFPQILPQTLDPPILVSTVTELTTSLSPCFLSESPSLLVLPSSSAVCAIFEDKPQQEEPPDSPSSPVSLLTATSNKMQDEVESSKHNTFSKSFVCNVCQKRFCSIKELGRHIAEHSEEWPFKCEFCVLLFGNSLDLLEHRSTLHGVGRIYNCCVCSKGFAFLCNLQQHQKDLHPGQVCTHTETENGKLRLQNYNNPTRPNAEFAPSTDTSDEGDTSVFQVATDVQDEKIDASLEELYATIKIMASEGGKPKVPNVRLGISQHYPSFKPPPFPYHNRTPVGSVVSATSFTAHNIPQTFNTSIRCTKCGRSFDNMPELHKHILACANASDKKRYTPKKNPIPLKQFAKDQNGVLLPATVAIAQTGFRRMGQPKRLNFSQELSSKIKLNVLNKRKNQLVQKAICQKNKLAASAKRFLTLVEEEQAPHVCPHCNRKFTYRGSLNKHVSVSCPMKPLSKKSNKGKGHHITVTKEHIGKLCRRIAGSDIKQASNLVQKTLGRTRARSSGPSSGTNLLVKYQPIKGKLAATQIRHKRPASFPTTVVPICKSSKTVTKANVQLLPQSPTPSLPPQPPGSSLHRQVARMQRAGKEVPPKELAEEKLQPSHLLTTKAEPFSLKTRQRVSGPVTRSLQLASIMAPAGIRGEDI